MVHLGPLPISSLVYSIGSVILCTVLLDGPLKAMLGTATATQTLFGYQSFQTQPPITISQSVAENETHSWNHIHPLRPYRDFIYVAVELCEAACRSSTVYYP